MTATAVLVRLSVASSIVNVPFGTRVDRAGWLSRTGIQCAMVLHMNTQDARRNMGSLATEGLAIVKSIGENRSASPDDRNRLRHMASEARTLLSEAGYPGDAVWRGLQRASIGAETYFDSFDTGYWQDVMDELERGAATLRRLLTRWAAFETLIFVSSGRFRVGCARCSRSHGCVPSGYLWSRHSTI